MYYAAPPFGLSPVAPKKKKPKKKKAGCVNPRRTATVSPAAAGVRALPGTGTYIGPYFNQWKWPVTAFGPGEEDMERELTANKHVGSINFSRKAWTSARETYETVLGEILRCMKADASSDYEGLIIQSFIRRGSSRDALKVGAADEFDVLLEFNLEGLKFEAFPLRQNGKLVAELGEITVTNNPIDLEKRFPKLAGKDVFVKNDKAHLLSSEQLHYIFVSLVDKAICQIQANPSMKRWKITRGLNPPSIPIEIDDGQNC